MPAIVSVWSVHFAPLLDHSDASTPQTVEPSACRENRTLLARMELEVTPNASGGRAPFTYSASVGMNKRDIVYIIAPRPTNIPKPMCCATGHSEVTIHNLLHTAARQPEGPPAWRAWSPTTVTTEHLQAALALGGTFACGATYKLTSLGTWATVA